jgi:hypothetical protein
MIIGFTGTSRGMTPLQFALLEGVIARLCPTIWHHGDCIGADAQAHAIVRRLAPSCRIEIHPPIDSKARAFCDGNFFWPRMEYLKRNLRIATLCEELVAAPLTRAEELRSGTWSTIRYARKAGKRIHMVWP